MKKSDDPAFPMLETDTSHPIHYGLTKREYFAGLAMQGLLARDSYVSERGGIPLGIADESIQLADELLKQL